jgi:hypothetical protein
MSLVGGSGVARSVLELAPILCAGCGQPFDPEDAGWLEWP